MKVETLETEESGFKPIVITIETAREAKALWHKFNKAEDTTVAQYLESGRYQITDIELKDQIYALWKLYNTELRRQIPFGNRCGGPLNGSL